MNTFYRQRTQASESDMERVIEPLASYISATNQPMVTLISALSALVNEVKRTNRAASAHVTAFMEHC